MNIQHISVDSIKTGERFRKDYGDLTELKESINKDGLINPITVANRADGFELIAGGRRLAAVTELDYKEVWARIYEGDVPPLELRTIELAENLYRKDLHYTEKVKLIAEIDRLQKEQHGTNPRSGGWSYSDTAKMIGSDKGAVSRAISLAEAIEQVPELGKCKNEHEARKTLSRIEEDEIKKEMARRVADCNAKGGTKGVKQTLVSQFIVGDAFEGIKKLKNHTVDIVEIDPPFGIDYKETKERRGGHDVSEYNEIPMDEYTTFLTNLFTALKPKLRDDAWVICWFGISHWLETVRELMQSAGLKVCSIPAIWTKPGGQCNQPDFNLANSYETFLYGRIGNATIENRGRKNIFDNKPINPDKKVHPTEKPIDLLEDILSCFGRPGQTILVPFLGSGNTLLAANNEGLTGVGFDLAQKNKDNFILKVELGTPGQYKT